MLSGVTSSSSSLLAELFRTLDRDSSSGISLAELSGATGGATGSSASITDIFDALDTDDDGAISQVEFTTAFEQIDPAGRTVLLGAQESEGSLVESLLAAMDTDGDGSVSEEEFASYLEEQTDTVDAESLFAEMDLNDDGAVDAAEITAYAAHATAVMTDAVVGPARTVETEAAGPSARGGGGAASDDESYDPLDTNRDGVVSAAELAAAGLGGSVDIAA